MLEKLRRKTNSNEKKYALIEMVGSRKRAFSGVTDDSSDTPRSFRQYSPSSLSSDSPDSEDESLDDENTVISVDYDVQAYSNSNSWGSATKAFESQSVFSSSPSPRKSALLNCDNGNHNFLLNRCLDAVADESMRSILLFCVNRNPWESPQTLYSEVFSLLNENVRLTAEIGSYLEALCPSSNNLSYNTLLNSTDYFEHSCEKNSKSNVSNSSDELESYSIDDDFSSQSSGPLQDTDVEKYRSKKRHSPRERILKSNEMTIMRTFMTFSVLQLQLAEEAIRGQNAAIEEEIQSCAEAWLSFAKLYM